VAGRSLIFVLMGLDLSFVLIVVTLLSFLERLLAIVQLKNVSAE
jgi:hypothetical protein